MTGIWAECPTHGMVYSTAFVAMGEGTSGITIEGSTVSCPELGCFKMASVIDAEYAVRNGVLEMKPISGVSFAQLKRLKNSLEWAKSQMEKPDADEGDIRKRVEAMLEKEAPSILPVVSKALGSKSATLAQWVMVILMIITLLTANQKAELGVDDVNHIIEQYVNDHPEPEPLSE